MKITLRASVAQRLSAVLLMSGLAITLLAVIAPEPAHAYNLGDHRWKYGTVCVVDRTGSAWPVNSATYRWSRVPDLTYRYGGRCSQKVYVYEGRYGRTRQYAHTECWVYSRGTTGSYEWLGDAWRVYRCVIRLNNTYRPSNWADRRSIIMHELGHTAGLEHTSSNALMNIYQAKRYNYPTYDDKRGVERRYPW